MKQFTYLQWRLVINFPGLNSSVSRKTTLHYTKGKKGKGTYKLKAQMAGAYPGFLSMKHA